MNVNGIGNQSYYEKTNGAKAGSRNHSGGFYESLSENLNERAEAGQKKENAAVPRNVVASAGYPYRQVASAAGVYENERVSSQAVSECEARRITYQESDYVKTYAELGYTLMAQIDVEKRCIYIEQKTEDGCIRGYEVNMDKLEKDSDNPIEQMALEACENAREEEENEEDEELTVEEALLRFYQFVEDRIKNGGPKYKIGNSEFSITEWNKLLENVDGQLDTIREVLRERIEKLKEQALDVQLSQKQQRKQDGLKEAEEKEIEEELLMSLFQDKDR